MDEGLYTRDPAKNKRATQESVQNIRLKSYGRKLKNKDSASMYYGQKIQSGKADNTVSIEEDRENRKRHKQGKKKSSELEKARRAESQRTVSNGVAISSCASNVVALEGMLGDLRVHLLRKRKRMKFQRKYLMPEDLLQVVLSAVPRKRHVIKSTAAKSMVRG
ncbi:MAG: hypothetical protein K5900_08080 [Butyrivibrio sp.]|nr:hypothetical protein [Butyrivibrio sp.]